MSRKRCQLLTQCCAALSFKTVGWGVRIRVSLFNERSRSKVGLQNVAAEMVARLLCVFFKTGLCVLTFSLWGRRSKVLTFI